MAKSELTKFYEDRLRFHMIPEPPTAEEALDAIDFEKGIRLLETLQQVQEELDEWLNDYIQVVAYTDIPRWQQGHNTLQPIRRVLNENRHWMGTLERNFMRWSAKQSNLPNIIYQINIAS